MSGVTLEDLESYDDLDITSIEAPGWGDGTLWIHRPGIEDGLDITELFQQLVTDGIIGQDDDTDTMSTDKLRSALSLWYQVILRCACTESGEPLFVDRERGLKLLKRKKMDTITSVGQTIFSYIYMDDEEAEDPKPETESLPLDSTLSIVSPPQEVTAQ